MANITEIKTKLESIRMGHHINVEDSWFSCPKSGDCCNEALPNDYCNCGADDRNKTIDEIIEMLEGLQ